jgi:DNA-binding MarR family transcriptional regulator
MGRARDRRAVAGAGGAARAAGEAAARRRVATRLHGAAIRVLRSVRAADAESGLSAARLSALSVLVFGGPRSPGALAAAEQVTRPTMTRLIDGLERDGYVRRERDPLDGRGVLVSALPRARGALDEARGRRLVLLESCLAGLDAAALGRVAAALDDLEAVLGRSRHA